MPYSFQEAEQHFKNDRFTELASDSSGLQYLKLRSLNRPELLRRLLQEQGLQSDGSARQLFRIAFDGNIDNSCVDTFIRNRFDADIRLRNETEDDLVNQLYKLQEFNWGGLHQNSLEKTIVDNYVKKIRNFDRLIESVEGELHTSLKGYVTCSWYNHWSSILIEDIFKRHDRVLPAIGLVKKIDFFVDGIPYDLKVTYLPEGFVKDRRTASGLRPELTLLKQAARAFQIPYERGHPDAALLQDLWMKIRDHPDPACRAVVDAMHLFRDALVEEVTTTPTQLMCWLYENQGVRRFDASNRLFLVLVDKRNYFESWKLKRAKQLLVERIGAQLSSAQNIGHDIEFTWEGTQYASTAAMIVVTNAGA